MSALSPIPIAFCITELDPGGAERALFQLVTRLDRTRWAPHVISLADGGSLIQAFEQAGIPVTTLHARGRFDLGLVFRLISALRKIRPQILQTFLFHANILGRIAGICARIPHIFSGIRVAERRSPWYLRIDRWTDFLVDKHVCVSEGVREYSQQIGHLPAKKLVVIPNGVEIEKFNAATPLERSRFGLTEDDFVVVSIGRLDHQKGYDFLIESIASWEKMPLNFQLLIAGEGPAKNDLQQLIEKHHLEKQIHLLGYVHETPGLLQLADLYVQTSRWEGMCNALMEAMAAQRAVISTQVEGTRELITDSVNGYLVPFDDRLTLISKIILLMQDAARREEFGNISYRVISQQYTTNTMVSAYDALYSQFTPR
jgi:glycosyltransferase involved in cell wall biosynthesis